MGLHDKHRERVRERLLKSGFDDLEPHQLLEYLLFNSIPRGDTNETAHRLINKFGSLNNVLEATPKELMLVEGIGPASALAISSYLATTKAYLLGTFEKRTVMNSAEEIASYFSAICMGNKYETAYALFADKSKRLITHTVLSEGNLDSTSLYTDKLASEALVNKAYYVAVAHNHPSGYIQPSPNDFDMAQKIIDALYPIGKHLLDFVIVDHLNSFSFSAEGFLNGGVIRNPYVHKPGMPQAPSFPHRSLENEPKTTLFLNDDA